MAYYMDLAIQKGRLNFYDNWFYAVFC